MSKDHIIYARHGWFQSSFPLECRSMGFCTEECRNEYFLEYRYRLTMAMEAQSRRTRSEARKMPVAEGEELSATGASSSLVPRSSRSLRLSLKQPYLLVAC
jgi:hypothetical protein